MPLPNAQFAELYSGLASHDQRLAQLREGIRLAREEEGFHELLLNFVGNERTIALLNEISDRTGLMEELTLDPMKYCSERGVPLPDGVTIASAEDGVT